MSGRLVSEPIHDERPHRCSPPRPMTWFLMRDRFKTGAIWQCDCGKKWRKEESWAWTEQNPGTFKHGDREIPSMPATYEWR